MMIENHVWDIQLNTSNPAWSRNRKYENSALKMQEIPFQSPKNSDIFQGGCPPTSVDATLSHYVFVLSRPYSLATPTTFKSLRGPCNAFSVIFPIQTRCNWRQYEHFKEKDYCLDNPSRSATFGKTSKSLRTEVELPISEGTKTNWDRINCLPQVGESAGDPRVNMWTVRVSLRHRRSRAQTVLETNSWRT